MAERIGILGAGREGLSVRSWLRRRHPGAQLDLLDERPQALVEQAETPVIAGPFTAERLSGYDLLVRSPGIPVSHPALSAAVAGDVTVTSATNLWFAAHPAARTIAITGTKGKSTTAALAAHILRHDGLQVRLGGNIGRPLTDFAVGEMGDADWWVVELSSYQLADFTGRPTIGALLNLSPEHLDWHGGRDAYYAAKLRLVSQLGAGPLVAHETLRDRIGMGPGRRWYSGAPPGDVSWPRTLRGHHNHVNAHAAVLLAGLAGVGAEAACAALADYRGLPHRLQPLGETGGRLCVNDSLATTPVATAAALAAYGGRPVTVLVGGLDRGVPWQHLAAETGAPHAVIGLPDSGQTIVDTLRGAGWRPPGGFAVADDLDAAVAAALEITPPNGVVLLSPGAPSFPRFVDYRARGAAFAAACGLVLEEWEA